MARLFLRNSPVTVISRLTSSSTDRNSSSECGSAICEFAIISALLLLFVGGAIEFGIAITSSQHLHNAVREAARIGSTVPDLENNDEGIENAVRARLNRFRFRNYVSEVAVSSGLVPAAVPLINVSATAACNNQISVTADGNVSFFILQLIGLETLNIRQSTTMRYQRQPLCP